MSQYDFDIGILGGGSAGLTMGSGAAQLGLRIQVIEGFTFLDPYTFVARYWLPV
ncbi:MAG: hypothetical protein HY787_03415 [Deltaproteobacteria bacterium]|nr:hypothetical protein [Deltaproteobacteria bacterium]